MAETHAGIDELSIDELNVVSSGDGKPATTLGGSVGGRPLIDPAPASERIDSGETADGQYTKRYPTTLNKNQSQPAVATRTTIENTIGTQALRMRNEYRGAVKPQRNPRLNLTG
jgi:hypothetical protein